MTDFVSKYGLNKEQAPTVIDGKEVDYDKVKLSIKDGKLTLNKYTCTVCNFDKTTLVEAYTNAFDSIIAISRSEGGDEGFLLKVTKSMIGTVSIRHLLLKLGFMSTTPVRADVIECGDGFLVLGVVGTEAKPEKTAPFGEVSDTIRIHKEIGEKIEGSDF